ncbi:hypothetical protein DITRI_Ditri03aG0197100 [Diplodiscus trichospermus]
MAKIILAPTFLFALLLISHGIRSTEEARLFKIEKADDHEYYSRNHVTNTMTRSSSSSHNKINLSRGIYGADDHHAVTEIQDDTNDFHPTSPGHSPSIGHSTPSAAINDHH